MPLVTNTPTRCSRFSPTSPGVPIENRYQNAPTPAVRPHLHSQQPGLPGHAHMPFVRLAHGRLVINPGSIGMPHGRTGAHWDLLGPGVELRTTNFDITAATQVGQDSSYPEITEWVDYFLHARATDADTPRSLRPTGRTRPHTVTPAPLPCQRAAEHRPHDQRRLPLSPPRSCAGRHGTDRRVRVARPSARLAVPGLCGQPRTADGTEAIRSSCRHAIRSRRRP